MPNLFGPEVCMDVGKMRNIQKNPPRKPSLCLSVRGPVTVLPEGHISS